MNLVILQYGALVFSNLPVVNRLVAFNSFLTGKWQLHREPQGFRALHTLCRRISTTCMAANQEEQAAAAAAKPKSDDEPTM
jgi:hypothetical protein